MLLEQSVLHEFVNDSNNVCVLMQVSMLEDSNICAIHAGRVTIM